MKKKPEYIRRKIRIAAGVSAVACWLVAVCMLTACSTTKHLPEGEVLYTGYKTTVNDRSNTKTGDIAMGEIDAALDKSPSTKMFGVLPIPIKVWAYNRYARYDKGFGRWMYNRFAADPPVFISAVNPEVRAKVATNILHDYGYFNGAVKSTVIPDKGKDSLKKASVEYIVDMRNPYYIDTIYYERFNKRMMTLMERGRRRTLLKPGDQFNVPLLDEERSRISTQLRNRGYYYFRPDYFTYQADTTLVPGGHISLKLIPVPGLPDAAKKPYFVGNTNVYLMGKGGEATNDSLRYKDITIYYHDKLQVRPNMMYRWLHYQAYARNDSVRADQQTGLYSEYRQKRIQERIAQLGIFKYIDMQYTPRDTTNVSDTLDLNVHAAFDKPYNAQLELNVVTKSNDQTGPGAAFTLTKNNVFGGGETWDIKLKGSYEWQTGGGDNSSLMNSWEYGLSSSLTFPRVLLPKFGKHEYDFPATTTFRVYADQLNRAKYYELLSFGGSVAYNFQPKRVSRHSVIPFRLSFNVLQNETEAFIDKVKDNPSLYSSLRNQFIPAIEYIYTYDNSTVRGVNNPIWFQADATSAGNITSCIYRLAGRDFNEKNKEFIGTPFAQFLKLNTEFRYLWNIDKNQSIATRFTAGVICAYGNVDVAPYSEQFYVGGSNSLRAFTVRSIGPGGFQPADSTYIDQTGDIRLEANAEYRFRIFGDLHGAIFLDAGNVWLLREDADRPNAKFTFKDFAKQIAVNTGVGIRYDMGFLVFRLDCGVALHLPYDTGRKGYYNITGPFGKSLGYHFAIGYPF